MGLHDYGWHQYDDVCFDDRPRDFIWAEHKLQIHLRHTHRVLFGFFADDQMLLKERTYWLFAKQESKKSKASSQASLFGREKLGDLTSL